MNSNVLTQYSLVSAIIEGVGSNGISVEKALSHGDHGLGTFQHMDGEMVMIDGRVYQYTCDGKAHQVNDTETLPFVQVTRFQPTSILHFPLLDKSSIPELLLKNHPNTINLFHSVKVEGFFRKVKLHVVRKQQYEGQPGAELLKNMHHIEMNDVAGTAFGFRSPTFTGSGLSVPGLHLHFVSADRQLGGHAMEMEVSNATLSSSVISRFDLELPSATDFNQASLACNSDIFGRE